jgi:hypothetical protein
MHLKSLKTVLGCFLFQKAKSHNETCSRKKVQVKDVCQVIAHEVAAAAHNCFAKIPLMFVYLCKAVT